MRITNFAIAFVLIFIPFYIVLDMRTSAMSKVIQLEDQYDAALKTASQDAAMVLNTNVLQEYEAGYQSNKFFNANKELAVDAFYRTLYLNFNVQNDPVGQGALASYVPAIIVVDYDGYWIYAMSEYTDADGSPVYKHMWRPKKPYAFTDDNGNTFNFTLDNYLRVYDARSRVWHEGFRQDLVGKTNVSLIDDAQSFEQKRRSIIVSSIQEDLAYFIDKHNEYASRNGISYTFTLPQIPQEEWTNSIDDIGVMAFIQGIPMGDQFYNSYAFGSGRLVRNESIIGAVDDATGMKYYYRSSCSFPYRAEETFDSEKDAAAAGYFPKECVNGQ